MSFNPHVQKRICTNLKFFHVARMAGLYAATDELVTPISRGTHSHLGVADSSRIGDILRDVPLHKHQVDGIVWMLSRWRAGRNVIVADEMGLGKTLQTLAFLSFITAAEDQTAPFLVVAPLSVVPQWSSQASHFIPSLRTYEYMGSAVEREEKRRFLIEDHILKLPKEVIASGDPQPLPFDVMITSYETCLSDLDFLDKFKWRVIVYDEGHRLKNPASVTHQTFLARLHARFTVILTGTPIQNDIVEFWSLLRFLHPSIFPDSTRPDPRCDPPPLSLVTRLVDAVVLRRLFALTGDHLQLPKMTQLVIRTDMTPIQSDLYRWALLHYAASLRGSDSSTSAPPQGILSNLLMTLRKISAHPYLIPGVEPEPFSEGDHIWKNSNKFTVLKSLLVKMRREKARCLIFSGFTTLLDICQDFLDFEGIAYERLDGSVRREDRIAAMERFSGGDATDVFLLSTRAGGVGLNLASANWVIFLDTDWNPQVDLQAIARVHRQGQAREVQVFRLVTRGTVDEVILSRSLEKLKFSEKILNEEGVRDEPLSVGLLSHGVSALPPTTDWNMPVAPRHPSSAPELDVDSLIESVSNKEEEADELVVVGAPDGVGGNYKEFQGVDYSHADAAAMDALVAKSAALPPRHDVLAATQAQRAAKFAPMTADERDRIKRLTVENREKRKLEKWSQLGYTSMAVGPVGDDTGGPPCLTPGTLIHLHGSVVAPVVPTDDIDPVIVHCVDSSGIWPTNSRLFMAIANAFPDVPKLYYRAKEAADLHLGDVHLVPQGDRRYVALCVCHRDDDLEGFKKCINKLSHKFIGKCASFHFPRIGERGGVLYITERIITTYVCGLGFDAYLYYHKQGLPPAHVSTSSDLPGTVAPPVSLSAAQTATGHEERPPAKKRATLLDYFKSVIGEPVSRATLPVIPEPVKDGVIFAFSPRINSSLVELYRAAVESMNGSIHEWSQRDADVYVLSVKEGKDGMNGLAGELGDVCEMSIPPLPLRKDGRRVRIINSEHLEYLWKKISDSRS